METFDVGQAFVYSMIGFMVVMALVVGGAA
jgi:hypothetical protein